MTPMRHNGFTLAEVLVASTISGFIAIVAVGAMNAVSHTAQTVNRVSEVNAEVRFAARMLAHDLANFYRDPNPDNVKLIGASQGSETTGPPFLTFYMVGRAKARADQPEGDVYEVEYFLGSREEQQGTASESNEPTVLFRRVWPNPDKERVPRGVLTPIADNIAIFYIRFSDGQEWTGQWTEEMRSLPKLIEVTLGTATPEKGDPVTETFTITFPRMAEASTGGPQEGESSEGSEEREESAGESPQQQGSPQGGSTPGPTEGNQGNQGRRGPQP
jgi:type II secretion system protein J